MMYFEDLEIGWAQEFGSYRVTREEVVEFATKYDPQDFHLSDEAAAETHFGRLAASGWHTCAMTMRMLVDNIRANGGQQGLGSPGVDELRWLRPVFPGDTLSCRTEILEKKESRSKPGIGSFRSRVEVSNQHGEPVLRFISIVLIRRRPG
jgi:acyl dehydratase